jgi:hypothetical protein
MNDEAGTFVFHNGRPALQDQEVNASQVKGMGNCESYRASAHNYHLERIVPVTHLVSMGSVIVNESDHLFVQKGGVVQYFVYTVAASPKYV